MHSRIVKALLLVVLVSVGFATSMTALSVLAAFLSPSDTLVAWHAIAVMSSPYVLPIASLAYIFSSKRFAIGWHWLPATVVSTIAVEAVRPLVVEALGPLGLVVHLSRRCNMQSTLPVAELLSQLIGCGAVSWLLQVFLVLSITVATGALLLLVLWIELQVRSLVAARRG